MRLCCALLLAVVVSSACASSSSSQTDSTPRVGQVWYVRDHAYTDEVYQMILQNGSVDTWPAQTTDDKPDKSYHLAHPYPCKITETGDEGFYKCSVLSNHFLGLNQVWTNRPMSREQAEADSPGTVIHTPQPEAAGTPSWLILRKGLGLYTGYDGGDSRTDTLCVTPGDYNAYAGGDNNAKCSTHAPGIPVHIIDIKNDYETDGKTNIPLVRVAADDGSFNGWSDSLVGIQPRIPTGTVLVTELHPPNDTKSTIWHNRSDDYAAGTDLEPGTRVQVLKNDPSEPYSSTLYVRVLTSNHAGAHGWMLDDGLNTTGAKPLIVVPS